MGFSKGLLQLRGASALGPRQQQPLLMGLITQFQAALGAAAALLLLQPVLQLLEQLMAERFTHSALLPAALLGLANAPSRKHPSEGMQQHPPQPQGFGQAAGQLAAGTAIGNQHPAADVMTAKQRHLLNRRGHGFHSQIKRALGQGLNAAPQRCRQLGKALLHHRQIRRLIPLGTKHRRELGHLQAPQQQMGIGEAKRPAPPVTSRPWISTSGTGPHLQALLLGAEDRTATGGNRMNRQPRCQQREAGNLGLRTALQIRKANTSWHAKDIGGGAAHVETHQGPIGHTSPLRRRHRSHHSAGGPRQDCVLRQQGRRVQQGSAGSHHAQSGGLPQIRTHLGQIGAQNARHRRFHQGRLAAGHQPRQGAHLMGADHGFKAQLEGQALQGQLMGGIAVGVHQGDRTAAQPGRSPVLQLLAQLAIKPQGGNLLAPRVQPAIHLHHRSLKACWPLDLQSKQLRPVLITDAQHIGQALVGDQQHPITGLLQQGIGGHGGAEAKFLNTAGRYRGPRRQTQQPANGTHRRITGLLRLHGEHLAHLQAPLRVTPHHIGEGAAAINPKLPGHQPMAARSTQSQTRPCCRNQLAGNCSLGPSWSSFCRIAALPLPVTTKWISVASRISLSPRVMAASGTCCGSPPNRPAFWARVAAESFTTRQPTCAPQGGSLKPTWPLLPKPSNCTPTPPAAARRC